MFYTDKTLKVAMGQAFEIAERLAQKRKFFKRLMEPQA
jgi:hypothetical protein